MSNRLFSSLDEKGLTLIEVCIVIGISGFLILVIQSGLIEVINQSKNITDRINVISDELILETSLSKHLARIIYLHPYETSPSSGGLPYSGLAAVPSASFSQSCYSSTDSQVLRYTYLDGPINPDSLIRGWDAMETIPARLTYTESLKSPVTELVENRKPKELVIVDSVLGIYARMRAELVQVHKNGLVDPVTDEVSDTPHSFVDVKLLRPAGQTYTPAEARPVYFPPGAFVYGTQTRYLCVSPDRKMVISFNENTPEKFDVLMNLTDTAFSFSNLNIEWGVAHLEGGLHKISFDPELAKTPQCAQVLNFTLIGQAGTGYSVPLYSKSFKIRKSRAVEIVCSK